jgi:CDP-glycerol glycerophosphotransferase (TagB/SpsB family)
MQLVFRILKRLVLFTINLVVLFISIIIPKTNEIIIVGGWFGKRFADNSKYFYIYLNENRNVSKFKKIIWITRSIEVEKELKSLGYEVYRAWSIKSVWYHLRAKVHVIDQSPIDINPFFSVRSKRINLWHGFPLKNIGSFMKSSSFYKKTLFIKRLRAVSTRGFWGDYYILATSDFAAEVLGKAFSVEGHKILISGYPRNYNAIAENSIIVIPQNEKKYYDEIEKYKQMGYEIIGYFPTFRDKKGTLVFGTDNYKKLTDFLDFCQELRIKIVSKFHFAGKNDNAGAITSHEAFINLPPDADVYTFLDQVDLLITDYSSIYYDFLLWKKPIIFFPYDLEYYRDEDRGLIFDYDDYTPGPKVYNISELKKLLSNGILELSENYKNKYSNHAKELINKVFDQPEKMKIDHLIRQINNIR